MRLALPVIATALISVMWVSGVSANPQTVTGKVVDLSCFNVETKANSGMDHVPQGRECAYACVKWWGQPVGIVTADGKVYQLAGGLVADNNARIAPHVTHTVTIRGDVTPLDGILVLSADTVSMANPPRR